MRRTVLALALASTACGSNPASPSSTATSTSPGGASAVVLTVKADAAGSRDAIASLSEVLVDASASTGSGLTFTLDFGDGTTATIASAKHTYAKPATYVISATVTDLQGRKATATQSIAVRDVTGGWFQAGFITKTQRVEVRNLSIDAQTGTTVSGTYRVTGNADRTFTGTLIPPRDIRMTASDGVSLIGTVPGRINDDTVPWTLMAQGDSADGQRLDFHAITGVPDGAPPTVIFTRNVPGNLLFPIAGVTAVHLDAGASVGSGLSYFLEFGDGFVATTPQADHAVDVQSVPESARHSLPGEYAWDGASATARVTVVDRFGRSDTKSAGYEVFDFGTTAMYSDANMYWKSDGVGLFLAFKQRSGGQYSGQIAIDYDPGQFSLSASGGTSVHLSAPGLGAEFDGTVSIQRNRYSDTMTLVERGGKYNGRTWVLKQYSDY
jgi:PKD repeat protein